MNATAHRRDDGRRTDLRRAVLVEELHALAHLNLRPTFLPKSVPKTYAELAAGEPLLLLLGEEVLEGLRRVQLAHEVVVPVRLLILEEDRRQQSAVALAQVAAEREIVVTGLGMG